MGSLFQRLLRAGAAYQAASMLSPALAILTLPLYTRYLTKADYGYAETLLTLIILASILLRFGLGEALVRFASAQQDLAARDRVARAVTIAVALSTSVAALLAVAFAGPLSRAILGTDDATLFAFGALGLWAFSNLEIAYALLRVHERKRTFVRASVANVLLTVALTVTLVVGFDQGARGLVAGNYVASTVVLVALWWSQRAHLGLRLDRTQLPALLAFGLPTVPADASVFALNVIDRAYLLRVESPAAAGLYALSVKLATVVIIAVRGFQLAWPPLAYSIEDDETARRFYARVTTYYVAAIGLVVVGLTLLGRWLVRLLAAPEFYAAHEALGWVALGWALYGLVLVFTVIAGRAQVTIRQLPAAFAGLVVNVVALVLLVEPLGIAGAGIALCLSYLVMLGALHLLTRSVFTVPFEVRRLAVLVALFAFCAVGGELTLPDDGAGGFAARMGVLGLCATTLLVIGFNTPEGRVWARSRRDAGSSRRLPWERQPPTD